MNRVPCHWCLPRGIYCAHAHIDDVVDPIRRVTILSSVRQAVTSSEAAAIRNAAIQVQRQWCLIIEAKTQRACFMINGKDVARSPVTARLFWIDPVGTAPEPASAEKKK